MATKEEKKIIAREMAALVLDPNDYNNLIEAIDREKTVMFVYNKLSGGTWRYKAIEPIEFVFTGRVYLWAYHTVHKRGHSFRAWEISQVYVYGDIVEALLNIERFRRFWDGTQTGIRTTNA